MKHPPGQFCCDSELGWLTLLIPGKHKWELDVQFGLTLMQVPAPTPGTQHRNVEGMEGNPPVSQNLHSGIFLSHLQHLHNKEFVL